MKWGKSELPTGRQQLLLQNRRLTWNEIPNLISASFRSTLVLCKHKFMLHKCNYWNGQTILGKYINFILLTILYIMTSDLNCTVLPNFLLFFLSAILLSAVAAALPLFQILSENIRRICIKFFLSFLPSYNVFSPF